MLKDKYLFRGKRADNGQWEYGCLVNSAFFDAKTKEPISYIFNTLLAEYDCFEDLSDDNGYYMVDKNTVGQYTGLKDKNGNKIFEGDVLNHKIQGERIVYYPFNERSAMFGLNCIKNGFKNYLKDSEIYEVIGNIHDN